MVTPKRSAAPVKGESEDRTAQSAQYEPVEPGSAAGRVINGRYRLGSLLGQGGMGEVWRAEHIVTGRPVALKLLRNALVHRPDMRRRFLREARAAAAVNHANVVEVLDAFEVGDGTPALVMPLLEGETLGALIARDAPLTVPAALSLLLPLISAVGAAHSRGIVHRDLKPENVFLSDGDGKRTVKVLDFGIAKLMNDSDGETLTGTGTLVGTPSYMAPEQGFGERDQDHRVDIWAIGVISYEALSGCRPIDGDNIAQVVRSFLTRGITPLEVVAPGTPRAINDLVMSMLARKRESRPQSLREVYEALTAHAEPGTPAYDDGFTAPPAAASSEGDDTLLTGGLEFAPTLDAKPVTRTPAPVALQVPRRSKQLALPLLVGTLALAFVVATVARQPTATPPASASAAPKLSASLLAAAPATTVAEAQATTTASAAALNAPGASAHRAQPRSRAKGVSASSTAKSSRTPSRAPTARAVAEPPAAGSSKAPATAPSPAQSGLQEEPPF